MFLLARSACPALLRAVTAALAAWLYACDPPGTATLTWTASAPEPNAAMASGALAVSCARYWPRMMPVATMSAPGPGSLTPGCSTTWPEVG